MVGGMNLKIGDQGVAHRDDHDFYKQPKKVEPEGEMSAFSDDPIHQHTAQRQKHGACPYESRCDEKIVASAHLKPCRFREGDIGGQKHHGK